MLKFKTFLFLLILSTSLHAQDFKYYLTRAEKTSNEFYPKETFEKGLYLFNKRIPSKVYQ